jgi:hypothetical protein
MKNHLREQQNTNYAGEILCEKSHTKSTVEAKRNGSEEGYVAVYHGPCYGPISQVEVGMLFLKGKEHENMFQLSLLLTAIHLIYERVCLSLSTEDLEKMIQELADLLLIPSDGKLLTIFPSELAKEITRAERFVEAISPKLRAELPEILLILQATNYLLHIAEDIEKKDIITKKYLMDGRELIELYKIRGNHIAQVRSTQ